MDFEYRSFFLYFPVNAPFPDLCEFGWHQIPAEVALASTQLNDNNTRVGIYYIDEALTSDNFEQLLLRHPNVNWIAMVSENGLKSPAVRQKISNWFYDYHTLPIDRERLLFSLGRAFGMSKLCRLIDSSDSRAYQMVGKSIAMKRLYLAIDKLAASKVPVLINGESGTGKELVAQAIHANSPNACGSIVELNCGALPRDLVQSELFGHEKGAFTGACQRAIGCVEAANGGTLFLDEIGDLPLEMQANLLRVLQEGIVQRVGSHDRVPVDVRIIAATHVDLEQAVREKRFREDLFYRLNVVPLEVPSLRTRGSDIELLAQHFLSQFRSDTLVRITGFSLEAISAMRHYSWPGNVRELINRVRRAIIMTESTLIQASDLGLAIPSEDKKTLINLEQVRTRAERETIDRALNICNSNLSCAAKLLGVSRRTLYRLIEKHCFVIPEPNTVQRT
ncbi:MAG: sigma 54-interacting transcriptional regulator [Pseudomonadales bacterium]